MVLPPEGWLRLKDSRLEADGLGVDEGDGLNVEVDEDVDSEGLGELDEDDGLEVLELLGVEGEERVKDPPPLRPALLLAYAC